MRLMNLRSEIAKRENRIKEIGVSLDDILEEAGVDRSTWTRWKNGAIGSPKLKSWSAIDQAIAKAEGRAAAA